MTSYDCNNQTTIALYCISWFYLDDETDCCYVNRSKLMIDPSQRYNKINNKRIEIKLPRKLISGVIIHQCDYYITGHNIIICYSSKRYLFIELMYWFFQFVLFFPTTARDGVFHVYKKAYSSNSRKTSVLL